MPLAHSDLQTLRTPLVHRQRRFSANWSRALILGTLLFGTLNSPRAQDTGPLPTGKPNPPYQASRNNVSMELTVRSTDPAHLLVGEQEAEEDRTT